MTRIQINLLRRLFRSYYQLDTHYLFFWAKICVGKTSNLLYRLQQDRFKTSQKRYRKVFIQKAF